MEQKSEINNKKSFLKGFTVVLLVVFVVITIGMLTKSCKDSNDIDDTDIIDLTRMNSTMVYSYVFDMLYTRPEDYLGKTVKAKGKCAKTYFNIIQNYRYFIVIEDATGCCDQGIEFVIDGDYPEVNFEIEIVGTFAMYEELYIVNYYFNVELVRVI